MRYQNFDNPIDYQCNNWWPSRRKGVGFSVVPGFGGKGEAEGLSGMGWILGARVCAEVVSRGG